MEHMEYITKEELKKKTTVSEYSRYSGYVRLRNAQGLSDYHCDQECFGYCRDSWQSNLERL